MSLAPSHCIACGGRNQLTGLRFAATERAEHRGTGGHDRVTGCRDYRSDVLDQRSRPVEFPGEQVNRVACCECDREKAECADITSELNLASRKLFPALVVP